MSGDQDLEFDLYDCNLDKVVAGVQGSMFAPAAPMAFFYDNNVTTPTAESLEMLGEGGGKTLLFPETSKRNSAASSSSSSGSNNEANKAMLRSQTSDLATSMTSADLKNTDSNASTMKSGNSTTSKSSGGQKKKSSSNYNKRSEELESEGESLETDRLLAKSNEGHYKLTDLAQMEDDLNFADD